MNLELFSAFLLIGLVVIVVPGPVVTLVIATGAVQGTRAALTTVAGSLSGTALLAAGVALGLTWIINSSTLLFETIRWTGAAYLVWLGVKIWRNAGLAEMAAPMTGRANFGRGFLIGVSNPKALAFFTAFLPQFVDPAFPPGLQLAVMCSAFLLIGAIADSGWAIASGIGRAWLMKPSRQKLLGRLSGGVLIGGGIWLSLTRRPA